MKKIVSALGVLAMLTACQKENSLEKTEIEPGSGGGGNPTGTRLVQTGLRIGADTVTTIYRYNSANLLSGFTYSGTVSGQSGDAQIRIVRNAANVINALVIKAEVYAAIGVDSIVTNFVHDAARNQYKYSVATYKYMGIPASDSAVFNYDAAGKLGSVVNYHDDGSGYSPDGKEEYTYSGNNLASSKTYAFDGSTFTLEQTTQYEQYDNSVNPLQFQADAPALGMTSHYSANNVVKQTVTDHTSASTVTGISVYAYNAANRPTKAISTNSTGSAITTYVYQ
ncbi:MAG: membrane lipoprotein lipid attachment site-containing protein [Bacteroidota bacterium]|nr:membrane lipoprotein lipid attachment site-containing protein [Bacteroidota bacterium]